MATVPQVTSGLGLRKFQADGFLLTRIYRILFVVWTETLHTVDIYSNLSETINASNSVFFIVHAVSTSNLTKW